MFRTEARLAPLLYNRDLSFKSISGKIGQVRARLMMSYEKLISILKNADVSKWPRTGLSILLAGSAKILSGIRDLKKIFVGKRDFKLSAGAGL